MHRAVTSYNISVSAASPHTVSREHNASGEAQATEREDEGVGCSQKIGAVDGEDQLRPPVHIGALERQVHWKVPDNLGRPARRHRRELRDALLHARHHLPVAPMVQRPGAVQVVFGREKAGLDLQGPIACKRSWLSGGAARAACAAAEAACARHQARQSVHLSHRVQLKRRRRGRLLVQVHDAARLTSNCFYEKKIPFSIFLISFDLYGRITLYRVISVRRTDWGGDFCTSHPIS